MSKTTLIDCCIKKYAYREISEIYKEIGASPQGLFPEQVDGMRRRYGRKQLCKKEEGYHAALLASCLYQPVSYYSF